jgi:hypothetical protein
MSFSQDFLTRKSAGYYHNGQSFFTKILSFSLRKVLFVLFRGRIANNKSHVYLEINNILLLKTTFLFVLR